MNPPICPTHNKPMTVGKWGGYICATPVFKQGDKTIWCDYKVEAPANAMPQNQPEPTVNVVNPPIPPQPIKERDYDSENRGKVRSLYIQALIQNRGLEPVTPDELILLNQLVEYAFTGTLPMKQENLTDEEFDEIQQKLEAK